MMCTDSTEVSSVPLPVSLVPLSWDAVAEGDEGSTYTCIHTVGQSVPFTETQ